MFPPTTRTDNPFHWERDETDVFPEEWFGQNAAALREVFFAAQTPNNEPPPPISIPYGGLHTPPSNRFAEDDDFRFPSGRVFDGAVVIADAEQEDAMEWLDTPTYNAYLMNRGCMIPAIERVAAVQAYMETYGVGKPPKIQSLLGPNGMMPAAPFAPAGPTRGTADP